jgi:diguanylate cyclase (GGDEF)-like protein
MLIADRGDQPKLDQAYRGGAVDFLVEPVSEQVLRAKTSHFVTMWHTKRQQVSGLLQDQRLRQLAAQRDSELSRALRNRLSSMHDALTGLGNRQMIEYELARWASRHARARRAMCAVLLVDIDNLKIVNDGLGRDAGDHVLRTVARRIQDALRPADVVTRIEEDTFGVLLDRATPKLAARIAARIGRNVAEPITVESRRLQLSVGIGISLGFGHPDRLQEAHTALSTSKRSGRGLVHAYDPAQHDDALERLALESDLKHALSTGEGISLHFQPIVDVNTLLPVSFEALCRWKHPTRGYVGPNLFVKVAEDLGIVDRLTDRVLDMALSQVRRWQSQGIETTIAVNVSAAELDAMLPERIKSRLKTHNVAARHLSIELTESAVMHDPERACEWLAQIRSMGVRIAIDDFGTGYSSLAYLHQLHIDKLKIDRSFVNRIDREDQLVDVVVAIGRRLNVEIVAEGVETKEQLDAVRRLGCTSLQGYLVARPLPADQVILPAKPDLTTTLPTV